MHDGHDDAILELRRQGLTQKAIAEQVGVSQSWVKRTLARLGAGGQVTLAHDPTREGVRAASHRRRLERALGELHGIACSLGQLNMRWALAEMDTNARHTLEAQLQHDLAALRHTMGQLKEAQDRNGTGP